MIWQSGYNDRYLPEKVATVPLPYIEMNPEDARRLGINSGDMVEVYNLEGNIVALVYVNDAPPPGSRIWYNVPLERYFQSPYHQLYRPKNSYSLV
jgi:Anaerobic dehydrogenases, typically selenocysteine-containing